MAVKRKTEFILDHRFDPKSCRHYVNGRPSVLHCHHYASLYTQLAEDCGMLDGKKLLAEVAEESFYEVLSDYYCQHNISGIEDRVAIAEQYYGITGMGEMIVTCAGPDSGEVKLLHSHVDEGWIKRWGKRKQPVNFITIGYISGLFAAVFNRSLKSYSVTENLSIVSGAEYSSFNVVAN